MKFLILSNVCRRTSLEDIEDDDEEEFEEYESEEDADMEKKVTQVFNMAESGNIVTG